MSDLKTLALAIFAISVIVLGCFALSQYYLVLSYSLGG